jgi:hypothetical protein
MIISPLSILSPLGDSSSRAWTPQKDAETKAKFLEGWEITGSGNLVGLILGNTLTVGGSAGSYTFQVPQTSPYLNADADYIWVRSDGMTWRMTTEVELESYDFTKTFVKYLNVYPYTISEIWILKAGQTLTADELNHMRDYCQLSYWWDNTLSLYGVRKQNRGIGQSVWIPDVIPALYDTFTDTNGVRLGAHTMVKGSGWTEVNGIWVITGNKLTETAVDNVTSMYAVADANKANMDISVDMDLPSAGGLFACGVVFRYQDFSHCWAVIVENDNAITPAPYIKLYLNVSTNVKGQVNITQEASVTRTLRVTVVGNVINVYWNGQLKIGPITDATYNTLTKAGIEKYRSNTASYIDLPFDNFKVL